MCGYDGWKDTADGEFVELGFVVSLCEHRPTSIAGTF